MRILTVRQPWAWAIAHGKSPENRSRNLAGNYRGPIGIHAGLRYDEDWSHRHGPAAQAMLELWNDPDNVDDEDHPKILGAVIAVANLWAVHEAAPGCCPNLRHPPFGTPWAEPDAWHHCLAGARRIKPIPARGRLGLWTPDPDLLAAITTQLQEA